MTLPSREDLRLALLRLTGDGHSYSIDEYTDTLATKFNLTMDERQRPKSSGAEPLFRNRCQWAAFDLKKAGLLARAQRGHVRITDLGRVTLRANPPTIDHHYLLRFPRYANMVRKTPSR